MYFLGGDKFPMDGSMFILNCDDAELPEKLFANDPFVKMNIVTGHSLL